MRAKNPCRKGLKIFIFLVLGFGPSMAAQVPATQSVKKPAHAKPLSRPVQPNPVPVRMHKLYSVHFPINSRLQFFASGESCDANGNLYLITGTLHAIPGVPVAPPDFATLPVTRLGLNSQNMTQFRPQGFSGSQNYMRSRFTVDDEGNLYWLFMPNSKALGRYPECLIVKYDSDGGYDSKVKIHAPEGMILTVMNMAEFADGNIFISGLIQPPWHHKPGARLRIVRHPVYPPGMRPFTGIFDDQGDLIATVHLPHDISFHQKFKYHSRPGRIGDSWSLNQNPVMVINNTLVSRGPNDTVYLLRPSAAPILYTISDAGQLLQQVKITALTAHHLMPIYMKALGQSRIFIEYSHFWYDIKKHAQHTLIKFAVNHVLTGKIEKIILPIPNADMMGCAFGNNFESTGTTHSGQMEVNVYSLGN